MKNSALSLLAILVLTLSFAVSPVNANDTASNEEFSVSLSGMTDFAMPGDTLEGQLSITLAPPVTPIAAKKQVYYDVAIATPLGDATVFSGSFRMRAGRTRTIPLSFPIEPDAAPGFYTVKIALTVDGETLSVGHTVEIGGKK
jgi:hypothetical protein